MYELLFLKKDLIEKDEEIDLMTALEVYNNA